MLITITDLRGVDGTTLRQWQRAKFALHHKNTLILSMSQEGACEALRTTAAREPTIAELQAWFQWQARHGRTNQRFVEAGLPWPAND